MAGLVQANCIIIKRGDFDLGNFPNVREILLDDVVDEKEFISIFNSIYKHDCFIYTIIPESEHELLEKLSSNFIEFNKLSLPGVFPREKGHLGYVKDSQKKFIFQFYLRSISIDYLVFSETDTSELLSKINNKNDDIFKIFEVNKIPHVTIGPDSQWLNVVEY
ncbi:hypothetical protein [Bacillus sp. EAC]|uniref:hypothetical protein n=1 Tax=Bacillus sp. EAC TaxID=1978338 RepID=UPI000B43C750|nr:hypothetical protein [Bacillus sp. EAC]